VVNRNQSTKSINRPQYWIPGGGGIHNPPPDVVDGNERWKFLWQNLKRWQQRIQKIEIGRADENSSWDSVDFVHAFILLCFQMRDWLIIRGVSKKDLQNLFQTHKEFQVCRDIANGLKHLDLDKPSISTELGLHREYDYFRGGSVYKITFFEGKEKYEWEITDFVSACVKKWEQFLVEKGMLVSERAGNGSVGFAK
jgi:hypothetical protein